MRKATRTAVVVVCAVAAVLAVAIAAYAGAGTLQGTLTVSPSGGHFGDELTIAPSMNTTGYPGDTVDIQYLAADNTWQKYGESLSLEDTTSPDPLTGRTTIGPLSFIVDESLQYPAILRAVIVPKDSTEGTCASEPVWVRAYKNPNTKVAVTGASSVLAGKTAVITGLVKPACGSGTVRITVKRLASGAHAAVYNVATDDSGIATFNFKRPLKGRYLLTERFLGNRFGAASGIATKMIVVK